MLKNILATLALSAGLAAAANAPVSVTYSLDGKTYEGKWILPQKAKGRLPGVVLFPDWMGVTNRPVEDGQRIAAWGYAVFVADPYGQGMLPKDPGEAGKLAGALKGDVPHMRQVAAAALATLKGRKGVDTTRVVALGYCLGGNMALELARSGADLKGTASIHGNLKTPNPDDAKNIKGPVLALHGGNDFFVTQDEVRGFVEEMKKANVDWRLEEFGGAVHGFTNPAAGNDPSKGVAYNPVASERAYRALKDFLAETLR